MNEKTESDPPQANKGNALAYYLVPFLVCVTVFFHLCLANNSNLTLWRTGGQGMYSGVDAHVARFQRIYLISDQGELPVLLPRGLGRLAGDMWELRIMPTESVAMEMAETLAAYQWNRAGEVIRKTSTVKEVFPVRGVRVEIWRYKFDTETASLYTKKITEATFTKSDSK